jgi:hypothetical protein
MNPVPFDAMRKSGASSRPRAGVSHAFEVVFQALPADEPMVLRSTTDANAATLAFHEALRHLTIKGATGELRLRSSDHALHPLLRQPL